MFDNVFLYIVLPAILGLVTGVIQAAVYNGLEPTDNLSPLSFGISTAVAMVAMSVLVAVIMRARKQK